MAFALDALVRQTLAPERFEVVIVRAETGDGETIPPASLRVHSLLAATPGAAAQRNVGWRAARAPLIAFLDDDCRPAPDWLERLLEAADGPHAIVQGRTEPDPDEAHLNWGLARSIEVTEATGWYETCNIAYPRSVLESAAGFDEAFPGAYGEDTDLALRVIEGGATVVFRDDAVVWHAVHPRPLPDAVRETGRRDVVGLVVKRHPSHRRVLYGNVFFNWRHAKLLLGLAVALLLRRRPALAALGFLPYLDHSFEWRVSKRQFVRNLLHLPPRLMVDGAEVFVVARSGVRHRVFIL